MVDTTTLDCLSADKNHPYYRDDFWQFNVLLDGQEIKHCITVNALEGWAVRMVTDALGRVKEGYTLGELETETIKGKFEIVRYEKK